MVAKPAASVATKYIAEQDPDKAAMLKKLHGIVLKGMPGAEVALKWGVPVYMKDGANVCAIASFKEHVALNFFVPPGTLADPEKKLEGGKTNRTLRIRRPGEIDEPTILRWVKSAAATR